MPRPTAALALLAISATGLAVAATPAVAAGSATPPGSLRAIDAQAAGVAAEAAVREAPATAHLGPGQDLTATRAFADARGTHVRMERTYRGLPVLGGDIVVHRDRSGALIGVSQTLHSALGLASAPRVGAQRARAAAAGRLPSGVRLSRDLAPTLVVDATRGTPRLVWDVRAAGTRAGGAPSRLHVYVDATTGRVRWSQDEIREADGTGSSLYSGTVPLQTSAASGAYELKDATRGGTYTSDMNNKTDGILCQLLGWGCSTGTLFTDADNVWGTGTTASRQSAAVDAQYGTNVTWDYYKNVHGRNGIFGTGKGSYNRVHYGSGYVNAFWDGTKMTYGDGDGTSFGPLVSLDVAGHEMSHGVTENTANLTYSGESGGLNEATSDIFGTMVEFYAANPNDPGDYLVGEEFDLKNHLGFRRMDNPSSDGKSAGCWSSTVGSLDVHYSSGVGNHFFYLLAEGSGAKTIGGVAHNSTTCNGTTVSGIGRDAAQRIWYRALTVYMTSSTTYAGARTATLSAARDLYGAGSAQEHAVAAVWSAVSVG